MGLVQTARGPVDAGSLGRTLVHEHLFHLDPLYSLELASLYRWDEEAQISRLAAHLDTLKANGIDTIVDVTAPGLGRQAHLIREVAERVEVNVVITTGWFVYDALPKFFQWQGPSMPFGGEDDPLVELCIRDLEEGIGGTGCRAGILKCTTQQELTPQSERIVRAVARAHAATGAPITTHQLNETGAEQQRVLAEEGVDLGRVVIGHCTTASLDFTRSIADRGSFVGFDTFGTLSLEEVDRALDAIVTLCNEGYGDRIVLANDDVGFGDWCWRDEDRATIWPRLPYSTVPDRVVPGLVERGVSSDAVDRMLIDNPRRLFA